MQERIKSKRTFNIVEEAKARGAAKCDETGKKPMESMQQVAVLR